MSVALADPSVSGKITAINQNAHTFTVQWTRKYMDRHNMAKESSREKTFKTSEKTIYMLGSAKGSWADLKKGTQVKVSANAGVADKVEIVSGS